MLFLSCVTGVHVYTVYIIMLVERFVLTEIKMMMMIIIINCCKRNVLSGQKNDDCDFVIRKTAPDTGTKVHRNAFIHRNKLLRTTQTNPVFSSPQRRRTSDSCSSHISANR